jgi:DNA-directed RNA polymerase specialized sigma24 family protein
MSRFGTTRWSLVIGAGGGSPMARRALDELCRVYRPPVLAYIRRHERAAAEAEDLTQAFFEQLLRLRTHEAADPTRGRFRVFLLVAVKRFLSKQSAFDHAAKRGGHVPAVPLDAIEGRSEEPADAGTPEAAFERAWAAVVVQQAAGRLQQEADAAGKLGLFEALRPFLLESPDADDYAVIAERLQMRRNTLAVAIHRMRQRLRELVCEELADTLAEADQLEPEMDTLQQALSRAR